MFYPRMYRSIADFPPRADLQLERCVGQNPVSVAHGKGCVGLRAQHGDPRHPRQGLIFSFSIVLMCDEGANHLRVP